MDYTITPAPRRSFVRRLAPWAASLGLFVGGGYGVYRYAAPAEPKADAAEATSAEKTAQDRLLAAMPGAQAPATPAYTTPFDSSASRYGVAPTLPPAPNDEEVATPRSAAAIEPSANPFATMPVSRYAERTDYATPTTAGSEPKTPGVEEAAAVPGMPTTTTNEATADQSASDVARGQEPTSDNPLRAASRGAAPASSDEANEARDAFRDAAAAADSPETTSPQLGAEESPGQSNNELTTVDGGRYGASSATPPSDEAEPPLADMSAPSTPLPTSLSPRPTADFGTPAPTGGMLPYAASTAMSQPNSLAASDPSTSALIPPNSSAAMPGNAAAGGGTGRPGERLLEGPQTPALTIQKLAPPEVQVGKSCPIQIRIQNNSQRTVHHVLVTDEVPLGMRLIGTAPKATASGAHLTWDLGTLSVGEERIVELELLPMEEGELGSIATVTFESQASAKSRSTRPQLALRLVAAPHVMIGAQQNVQIEVTNPGSGEATGVMLLETVPQGVTHEAGPALEFEVGTLKPGETRRLELVLQANEAGLVDNIMTARADANLQVQANCQFEVIAPELKVSVEGPARRILERPATYKVNIDNPGTATAREVQLVTQLPKGLKFVSANNMGEYDAATHSVRWSLAELPANEKGSVELTALAIEPGDQTLQVATRAEQGLEDRAEAHLLVEGIVALSFEVQDMEDAIEVGGETVYRIRVLNQGTKAATNVQIMATMPPGLRAQTGQGDARYAVQGDRVAFAPIPQLPPKGETTLQFRVQGVRPGDQRVTLQVTTDEVREPITEVESTQVYADE